MVDNHPITYIRSLSGTLPTWQPRRPCERTPTRREREMICTSYACSGFIINSYTGRNSGTINSSPALQNRAGFLVCDAPVLRQPAGRVVIAARWPRRRRARVQEVRVAAAHLHVPLHRRPVHAWRTAACTARHRHMRMDHNSFGKACSSPGRGRCAMLHAADWWRSSSFSTSSLVCKHAASGMRATSSYTSAKHGGPAETGMPHSMHCKARRVCTPLGHERSWPVPQWCKRYLHKHGRAAHAARRAHRAASRPRHCAGRARRCRCGWPARAPPCAACASSGSGLRAQQLRALMEPSWH